MPPRYITYVFEADDATLPEQIEQLAAIQREAADECELILRIEEHSWSPPALLRTLQPALEEIPY